ncbi:MAG: hypothetical protein CVT92_02750 [Bacteroidetes bacterium HGW-Bacteroidetes-1]|jgi:hypothetical protein|nr:MAG: hypothetical protein CVT92_02750 [Bacteroidetes bacterium HGW-Bacteroidetes-1]
MTRQTSKQTFKEVERELRSNPDMASYIRQTYSPATVIRQVADKSFNEDLLKDRQLMQSLTGTAVSPCWFETLKSSIKCHLMSKTF